jgi:hypothetical protein
MKMIMDLFGKAIYRFELRKALTAADGSKPPYVATITIWIADEPAFNVVDKKYAPQLVADVHNFTNTTLVAQRDELFAVGTA